MNALANQLTLLRDAILRSKAPDPVTARMSEALVTELIAADSIEPAEYSAASEIDWLGRFDREMERIRSDGDKDQIAQAQIDTTRLARFLSEANDGDVSVAEIRTVSAGMSKKTVLVTLTGAKNLPERLALRIDRSANNYLGTTVLDEFGPLSYLWQGGARIPRPYLLEASGEVIGGPFIICEHVDGAPAGSIYFPPQGPNGELLSDVATCMAGVHGIDPQGFPTQSAPRGNAFFDRQFKEHADDWKQFRGQSAIMDAAFRWIEDNRELAYGPEAIVHDDFAFNNMLVKDDRVSAVLDWEFAHIGTQAADLAYLWYAAEQLDSFDNFLTAYAAAGGVVPDREQLEFYRLWGQLRLGVMGFKAVRNFEEGRFDDVRYAMCLVSKRKGLTRIGGFLAERGVV